MPKYHFSQGKIWLADELYNPLLDERSSSTSVVLIILPNKKANKQISEPLTVKGEHDHDRKQEID